MGKKPLPTADQEAQRLQLLVNAVTDYAIYMLDPDGRIATWNAGARRFKGYEAGEIIGKHFSRFFTPEDQEANLPARILETARTEGRFEAEGWRVRKDGERFWAHVVVDPIRADDGTLLGFAKITRDITDRVQREQALYESEQRFSLLVQGVRDYAIYMLDTSGHITNWNAGAASIKGYSAEEIVGAHFSRFYTEEDRAAGEPAKALQTALREGKYEREAWRIRKDGSRFFASVVIDPIHDENGRHIGFAKITRDITERRQAQLDLEEARAALFQAQKLQALGELTGGIAHDFNNLMTVIRGSADFLKRDDLPKEKRLRYLLAIIETADRAATLTSHLLAFGRRQALKPEVLDLNVRMDALAEVLSRTLGRQIGIRLDLANSLWLVEVDPAQLETAILNAAINARDAMPEGGQIVLATRNENTSEGDMVRVAITDSGSGMSEDVLNRAFEPFFTTKPVGKGTGLGLSQIHGFAAQTGGRAEIESRPGAGTTLSLLLPRSEKPLLGKVPQENGRVMPHGLKILVVEDNDQVREFVTHLLTDLNCAVFTAVGAGDALAILEEEEVDLLFSDVVMPTMNGIELGHEVRARLPNLPILLASGYSEEVIKGAAANFDFVRKPYDAVSLSEAICHLLGKSGPAGMTANVA